MGWKTIGLALICAGAGLAQPYEIGGTIGYGWYRNGTIFGPGSSARAGILNRFAAGAVIGEDLYDYISGEFRYVYHDGHPFLGSGASKSEIQGQSHTLTYDAVFHAKPRESRLRPFVAAGLGAKGYIIAGPPPTAPPLASVGSLTTADEWHLVVDVGGGVKYRLTRNLLVRVDFRDYMTTFPKRQIAPAAGNTARGIFQQFTVLPGLSWTF